MTNTETPTPRRCRRSARALITALVVATLAAATGTALTVATAGATASSATTAAASTTAAVTTADTTTTTYGVGILTLTLVDPTRSTAARGSTPASANRTITVTIRYPVITTSSTETTAAVPASGSFPLVVFVHGYDTSAATYAAMEHDLAAAGFVVVAPDFPLSSSALDGQAVRDPVEQAADVSFVISTMTNRSTAPALLARTISTGRVGVIGHSDGGITAAGVAYNSDYADPRIGAAVVLSGAETAFPGSWFTGAGPALLAIHGTADEVNPYSSSEQLFEDATGPKYLVSVDGGSHLGPFTTDPVRGRITTLVADFLHAQLQGSTAAAARVISDATVAGALSLEAHA